jgi:hypothetical protein
MLNTFWKVAFCHMLGISLLMISAFALDVIGLLPDASDRITRNFEDIWIFSFFGVLAVSLAIWDGQFIDDIKESHWFSREMREFRAAKWEKRKAGRQNELNVDELDFADDDTDDDVDVDDNHEAVLAIRIQNLCQAADMHTEYLSNPTEYEDEILEYERETFEKRISNAMDLLNKLTDEFYWDACAHSIIGILVAAGDTDRAEILFSEVKDEFIREKILKGCPELAKD